MIMNEIVYKLPKGVSLSEHLRENALAYFGFGYMGHDYYIPITKEAKKLFKMNWVDGKLQFENHKEELRFGEFVRYITGAIYLQMRDTIGAKIHQEISQDIQNGFAKLFDRGLEKMIDQALNRKLLSDKKK